MALAATLPDVEILSVDSMCVYRHMDIGTAKPSKEDQRTVPHHLIDLVGPDQSFSVGEFQHVAAAALRDIEARGRRAVLVGGTGLYVKALVDGLFLQPQLDPGRRRRLEAWTSTMLDPDLVQWAGRFDPGFRGGGRQRAARAIEIALLTGHPLSYWQAHARALGVLRPWYVVLTAPRAILHQRIVSPVSRPRGVANRCKLGDN